MTPIFRLRMCGAALAAVLVSGCGLIDRGDGGFFYNPKDDYLESVQHNKLVVPEDLRTLENTDPFPIPVTPPAANPSFYPERPPLPDAIYANDNRDEVRIQRLGDRRWLVVPEPPTTAWPKVKQFMAENGVALVYDDPSTGRLNTDWLLIENTDYRDVIRTLLKDERQAAGFALGQDRFLIRVEQGLRPLTTEVHIRHENDSVSLPLRNEIVSLQGVQSHITGAEEELLSEVGAYIAAKVSEQTVSKVALQIGSSKKSELGRDSQGYPVLHLYLDYERAWATLGQALENAEVDIVDLDRDDGRFDISIPESVFSGEEGGGFFCRFTFSCDNDDELGVRLRVSGDEQDYRVSVLQVQSDQRVNAETAQQVLVLLREFAA